MDEIDRKLILLLRRDGRESIANLAAALGVSRATVRHRLEKLRQAGSIIGFTVQLREDATPRGIRALTMVSIEGHKAERIISRIYGIPAAQLVHTTNGKWDLVVELLAPSLEDLDAALTVLRKIEGI